MFKRKRVLRSPLDKPASPPVNCLEFLHTQAQTQVNNFERKQIPELLTRLNTDIGNCEAILQTIKELPVLVHSDSLNNDTLPMKSNHYQSFLLLHTTLSLWSVNPILVKTSTITTIKDILLGIQIPFILETTKSLIFLKSTCSSLKT